MPGNARVSQLQQKPSPSHSGVLSRRSRRSWWQRRLVARQVILRRRPPPMVSCPWPVTSGRGQGEAAQDQGQGDRVEFPIDEAVCALIKEREEESTETRLEVHTAQ